VWLALLPLLVAWKLWLFRPGQFHVQWVMSRFEVFACVLQEVMVWAALYAGVGLVLRWTERAWARKAALVAGYAMLLLHLVDVRCKQLVYQPLRWSSLREALAEAGVARSSASLFFGNIFVAAVLASFAVLVAAQLGARTRAGRRFRSVATRGETSGMAAIFLVAAALVAVIGRAQPYHLDGNVLSSWAVDYLRERRADAGTRGALAFRCDEKAEVRERSQPIAGLPLARRRNVVVFVAESLSYQASSLGSQALETTPFLRRLAALGPISARCRVQTAASTKSLYSLLTGRYASAGLELLESMAPHLESLPRTLGRAGYFTAFLSSQYLSFENSGRQYRAMGFDRLVGAEELMARARRAGRPIRLSSSWGVDDRELAQALPSMLPPQGPFFLVVYDVSAHHPFDYPEASPTDGDYQRYLRAIRYGDDALNAAFDAVVRRGHADDTLFVLLGDHGENISAQQYTVRGCLLSEIEHVVPLVFALPGGGGPVLSPAGAREIDIAPTILDLLGVAPDSPLQGRSLLDGRPAPAAYLNSHGRCQVAGVVEGSTKLVLDLRSRRALSVDLIDPDPDAHPRPLDAAAAGALAARLEACATYNEDSLRALLPRY
jgi:phosphoglycerol transferase MdoB-like AlkP superfamily enzyme